MTNKIKWFKEFPQKAGIYWFYGYRFKPMGISDEDDKKEFHLVKVNKIANGLMHTMEGQFLFEAEIGKGLFCKAVYPDIPMKECETK